MEARIYFRRQSVLNRLEKNNVEVKGDVKGDLYVGYSSSDGCHIKGDKEEPNLAYQKITDFVDLEVHHYLKGLKIVKISLFDTLSKEENLHIKQGSGSEGKSHWSISYGDKRFTCQVSGNEYVSEAHSYISLVKIRIKSTDLQSAKACYDKIRKGEMNNTWKGELITPSHCTGANQEIEDY